MWLLFATCVVAASAEEKPRVLVLDLRTDSVTADEARVAGTIVSSVASEDTRLTVLTMADLRALVALEGERAASGCDAASCLAELAAAMGSRYVVHGEIGRLGSVFVVSLALFDADTGTSLARRVVQAPSAEALPGMLAPEVRALVSAVPRAPAPSPGMVWIGASVSSVGVLAGAGLGIGAAVASSVAATATEAPETKRDAIVVGQWLLGGAAAGAVTALVGVALLGAGLMGGE